MNDLKFAFRQLLKNSGFTAVAMLTLALGIGARSNQLLELLDRESGVPDDFPHCESVDRIATGIHDDSHPVAHDRVLPFADDLEGCLLQRANRAAIVDAWKLGHRPSDGNDLAGDSGPKMGGQLGARLKVFANGVPDIFQGFLARGPLAATAGKFIAPDGKSLFGLDQCYGVIHGSRVTARSC